MPEARVTIPDLIKRMTVEQKIGQCVVVGMSGTQVTNDLREAITRYHCSGIRLSPFSRMFRYFNEDKAITSVMGPGFVPSMHKTAKKGHPAYLNPAEFADMLNGLRRMAQDRPLGLPLHMVIDQEGDVSKDYSRGGVVQFPSNLGLAAGRDARLVYDTARAIGRQMKAAGLDMVHSPVVDVNINPDNPEIGHRAFGDDPVLVAEYGIAMVRGFQDARVIAAAKHFPGRGDSATDAHHACPVLDVDLKRFHEVELYPYKRLIEAGIDSIMVAHCIYPMIDKENISTVSRAVVTGLLREELGFSGVITTDSMTMGALIDRFGVGEACARALAAGVDIILMKSENRWRGEMFYTIGRWVEEGRIPAEELDRKVERILALKKKYGLFDDGGIVEPRRAGEPFSDPLVVTTARRAAIKAAIVVKDELHALPVDTRRKVLLINQQNSIKTPNDRFDHPGLLQEILEEEWPTLQTYETDFGWNAEDETGVIRYVEQEKPELIICTNFYDRSHKVHDYIRTLIDRGYPVVLITNTPYCMQGKGGMIVQARTIVLNMNLTPEGYRVTRDILLGRAIPEGGWPLSNHDPLGMSSRKGSV